MSLAPGIRLGPYEIVAAVGAGGMGEVYRARDTRLNRTVAIKILPEQMGADPQLRERFDGEAQAIASLNHPHICTLAVAATDAESLLKQNKVIIVFNFFDELRRIAPAKK
jgi:serine/threonine protein kinase